MTPDPNYLPSIGGIPFDPADVRRREELFARRLRELREKTREGERYTVTQAVGNGTGDGRKMG